MRQPPLALWLLCAAVWQPWRAPRRVIKVQVSLIIYNLHRLFVA